VGLDRLDTGIVGANLAQSKAVCPRPLRCGLASADSSFRESSEMPN